MERLMIRCSGCGDAFTIAEQNGRVFRDFRFWGGSFKAFMDEHHAVCADPDKLLGDNFTLEDDESMKEATK